jgi:hypothetical protein
MVDSYARDKAAESGLERKDEKGQIQSAQGWRIVYEEVMSQSQEMVISSVVQNCAAEWYRLGR